MVTTLTPRLVNVQEVTRAYNLLVTQPGQIVEIRALDASREQNSRWTETLAGYFDNINDLLREISTIQKALGIYITLQPCDEELINRAYNRLVKQQKNNSTSGRDITAYRWLAIDCDPDRKAGISATDQEHDQAIDLARTIRCELLTMGWPTPLLADSGNGAHLLYRIELPVDETDLVKRVLEGLAARFDNDLVHVDQTLFDPSRIIKLYGSLACKGDNTPKRPHRYSCILEYPEDTLQIVSRELLETIATQVQPIVAPTPRNATSASYTPSGEYDKKFDLLEWAAKYHVAYDGEPEPYMGGIKLNLVECPFCHNTDHNAILTQRANYGALGFTCQHNSCKNKKNWEDFRLVFEPDAYPPKNVPGKKKKQAPAASPPDIGEPEEETALTKLLRIISQAHFICTPDKRLYARVPLNDHHEIVSINEHGSGFKRWLVYSYKKLYGTAPNSDALTTAMLGASADAEHEGDRAKVYTRIAEKNGCVYLDLANDKWECVEIAPDGYRVITCPPVYFRRSNGMKPLPVPRRGGNLLDDLRKLINAKEDKDYTLIAAWLVGTLHPRGPYAVLNLTGERGSAKSKGTTILRNLIDPSEAPTRGSFKDPRDAAIGAQNNMIIALDNLSKMPEWLSDVMCRIATGSGHAERALYTDEDEIIFNNRRPIIMNGIEDVITAPDLLSRAIIVTLEPPDTYLSEETIDEQFEQLHPQILGSLLQAAALALRNRRTIQVDTSTRMMDFAAWVTAAEPALKWNPGTFMQAYSTNLDNSSSIAIEASPVAQSLLQFFENRNYKWSGSTTELLAHLQKYELFSEYKYSPKNAIKLSGSLKRLAPALRKQGLDVHQGRGRNGSEVTLKKIDCDDRMPPCDDRKKTIVTPPPADLACSDGTITLNCDDCDDKTATLSAYYPQSQKKNRGEKEEKIEEADKVENLSSQSTQSSPNDEYLLLYIELEKMKPQILAPHGSLVWFVPDSGYEQGPVTRAEYGSRLKALGMSDDPKKYEAGILEMRKKLARMEGGVA